MNTRRISLLAALPAASLLAACSSSTNGSGHPGSASGASSSGSSSSVDFPSFGAGSSGSSSGSAPASLSALVSGMQAAVASVTSAHVSMNVEAAGQKVTGEGDEQLAAGKLVAMDMTMQMGAAGEMEMIIVDGKAYVKMPAAMNPSSKPYTLLSPDSSNPTIKSMASSLDSTMSSAALSSYAQMMSAASSFKLVGPESVGGVAATHYSLVLDTSKLPEGTPGREAIVSSGISQLPLDLYLDDQNRAVQVTEHLSLSGQTVDTKVTVSAYNKPVSISAPPADQVYTG